MYKPSIYCLSSIDHYDGEVAANVLPMEKILENDDVFDTCNVEEDVTSDQTCSVTSKRKLRPRKSSDLMEQSDISKKIRSVVRQQHFSADDEIFLEQHRSLVKTIESRKVAYAKQKKRAKEFIDEPEVLREKVKKLADLVRSARHTIVYTGAGISTSADIPDYRGEGGVWTRLVAGQELKLNQSLTNATPTDAHMALSTLIKQGVVKYIVSQNCDGLHHRSGVLSDYLAEIHGNMFAEMCSACGKQYYRIFDVTENTSLRRHSTKRECDVCEGLLKDTIVHFGEHSDPRWPHNWTEAERNADQCDLILCLGSSLKVLRSYKKLWLTDRKKDMRPILCIVNIQWTPKDSQAQLKINGKTDEVMRMLMEELNLDVSPYHMETDPLLEVGTPLKRHQRASFRTQCITIPPLQAVKFSVEQSRCDDKKQLQRSNSYQNECSNSVISSFNGETSQNSRFVSTDSCIGFNEKETEVKPSASNHVSFSVPQQDNACSDVDDLPSDRVHIPAWFGKGKKMTKKCKIKKRRQTT